MTEPSNTAVFRLGYVPGVTPGKWARIWAERRPHVPLELVTATTDEAVKLIRAGAVDAALVRLPIDRTGLHTIPLYTETTVAVVPKDHVVTATEEATVADLADEIVLRPQDDTLAWPGDRPGRAAASPPRRRPRRSSSSPRASACWSSPSRWPASTTAGTSPTDRWPTRRGRASVSPGRTRRTPS